MRSNVGDLVSNNILSGRRGAELCRDADAAGAAGMQFVHRSSTESAGATANNTARFMRNFFTKRTAWPQEYRAQIRVRKRRGKPGETKSWMSFWLPHELLCTLHHFGDDAVLADRGGLDQYSLAHMLSVDRQMQVKPLPLGFWQDGVPVNWDRTVTLEMFTLSLPGQSGEWKSLRLPLTALLKHQIGEHTMEDICNVIAWSLRWLALGKYPPSRHDNQAWEKGSDAKRKGLAGQALPCQAVLAQIRGDWKMFKELFKLPRWDEKSGCCFRCWVKPSEVADQVGPSAPWRRNRKTWSDVIACIWRSGCRVNPLLQAPYVSLRVIRIDWLHCGDMGCSADFQAGTLWYLQTKMPGSTIAKRVSELNDKLQEFYDANRVTDRLRCLGVRVIKRPKKAPKLKMQGAICRAMVPFTLKMAEELCDLNDPLEQAACYGMRHLNECYKALSARSVFGADILQTNAPKFALFYSSLARMKPSHWRVKPKLHAWLEAAAEGGEPASNWCYRDEDFGGSVSSTGRSRGSCVTVSGVSRSVLRKFGMRPIVRMR